MNPLKITDFVWDDASIESATKHGFSLEEIEAAFTSRMWILKSIEDTYLGLVQFDDGRYVELAFEYLGEGTARVFHCANMQESFQRRYEDR